MTTWLDTVLQLRAMKKLAIAAFFLQTSLALAEYVPPSSQVEIPTAPPAFNPSDVPKITGSLATACEECGRWVQHFDYHFVCYEVGGKLELYGTQWGGTLFAKCMTHNGHPMPPAPRSYFK
jgi:hypothetical protein